MRFLLALVSFTRHTYCSYMHFKKSFNLLCLEEGFIAIQDPHADSGEFTVPTTTVYNGSKFTLLQKGPSRLKHQTLHKSGVDFFVNEISVSF